MQIYNTSNSSSYFFPIIEPVLLTQPSVPVIPPPIPAHVAEESFIVQSLGGGRYDDLLQEIVPNNPLLISSKFNLVRELFSKQIGNISTSLHGLSLNTATDDVSLKQDAEDAAPKFIENIRKMSEIVGVEASFGPGDQFAVKSESSLKRKIFKDSEEEEISIEESVQAIGDALRGSIILDTPEQVRLITKKTEQWISKEGGEILWKNIFEEKRHDGYVGIHGKILLPFTNRKGEKRQIRCELQIHFRTISDGSLDSPKERMHLLYKGQNETITSRFFFALRAISKLSFISGMLSIGEYCRIPQFLISAQAKESPPAVENLCEDPEFSNLCEGNLAIPRRQMPQLSGSVKSAFLEKKENQGIKVERRSVPATELTAVQNELSRSIVDKNLASSSFDPCKKRILVSSKNEQGIQYVIDGHHRYAACSLLGGTQEVIAIDDDISNILSELETFEGVRHDLATFF